MMNTLKLLAGGVCLALCSLTVTPNAALAHGEKALEPFVRMRTVQFYDVIWSKDQLNVNDEVVVSGKFHVAEDWPRGISLPQYVGSGTGVYSNRALFERTAFGQFRRFEVGRGL
jgi:methane/ammonia monooxygenase subunit B